MAHPENMFSNDHRTKDLFFVTDLHGHKERYLKLDEQIRRERPAALFIGGDIMPHFSRMTDSEDFFTDFMIPLFRSLKADLASRYPEVFIIMGNDDPRVEEVALLEGDQEGIWHYMHNRKMVYGSLTVYGYACIPPTPFRLKDWERYDVSRYVDPGCTHPTEGIRTVDPGEDIEYATMRQDLLALTGTDDLSRSVFLFHTPPYQTRLDRAALDGMMIDHVPLDPHIGSIAVKELIESRQPWITLHGHVHESTRLTGAWHEMIGATFAFNGATDSRGLSLIVIPMEDPSEAHRYILF